MAALSEGDGVGLAGVDELFALLALLFLEIGHGREQEAEFAGGGDGLAVFVGVGVGGGEDVDLVGESVGGDGAEDVGSVGLEVAEVGVDGGAGAAELSAISLGGESLAVEVVGFEDASAASGGGWVGHGMVRFGVGTYVLLMVCGFGVVVGRDCVEGGGFVGCWWGSRAGPRVERGGSGGEVGRVGGSGRCAEWCEIPAASAGMTRFFLGRWAGW